MPKNHETMFSQGNHTMRRNRFSLMVVLLLCAGPCLADPISYSYTGTFGHDDDVATFQFDLLEPFTVGFQTFSFAGGTNGAGSLIAPGGFAPIVTLFDGSGLELFAASPMTASCGTPDPATGFCWDANFSLFLPAGSYLAILTEDDNSALGPTLADGFLHGGEGDFTGPMFLGAPGSFVLIDGSQRDGHYALDITLPDTNHTPVPEPATLLLLGSGLLGVAGYGRKKLFRKT